MPLGFLNRRFINYLQEFFHDSRAIGIILLSCTVVSLILTNTPLGMPILHALHFEVKGLHLLGLPHSVHHFINDGLMAVFFFLVGMEIRRELMNGELSTMKRAMLPIAAAVGGMIAPAAIFILFNKGTVFQNGWGIPTATDIAFSLGVASLVGKKFPLKLKIFLTALAIIDDLGAILVIAFFYGGEVSLGFLTGAILLVLLLWQINKMKLPFGWIYLIPGIVLWWLVFNSGLHATIGGVIFAFLIPEKSIPRLQNKLHNFVHFLVLPVFALANTAIVIQGGLGQQLVSSLSLGIMFGLVVGKPLGIFFTCRFMVQRKLAELPDDISWAQLAGAGILAGIGFTMSIFIATLAFTDTSMSDTSKIAILISACISVVAGLVWFHLISRHSSSEVDITETGEEELHRG
ncbi:MAG TPA: Na+/H+ antiporter NhaA [Phnomibacter sp.]|nr:Na+/H+ antiporter NhaA [Phnomibacter sp.]